MLIVVRLTMGLGWTQETSQLGTGTMVFARAPNPRSRRRSWDGPLTAAIGQPSSNGASSGDQSGFLMTLKGRLPRNAAGEPGPSILPFQ